jgi:hypothetical protein
LGDKKKEGMEMSQDTWSCERTSDVCARPTAEEDKKKEETEISQSTGPKSQCILQQRFPAFLQGLNDLQWHRP